MRRIQRKDRKKKNIILFTSLIIICSVMIVGYSTFNTNLSINTKGNLKVHEWNFDYTGSEQTFIVPKTGNYLLETWGAQGGSCNVTTIGGYGGYSVAEIKFNNNSKVYINVGGKGTYAENLKIDGGYNGGGDATAHYSSVNYFYYASSGGGATHVSNVKGTLNYLENYLKSNDILLVAGGGGGSGGEKVGPVYSGGCGGGFIGCDGFSKWPQYVSNGGSQSNNDKNSRESGWFGHGCSTDVNSGGGGGLYGGNCGTYGSGGGGSGYIGNTLLTNKHMACYNCEESNEESTKTISVTCASESPTKDCAKIGNGYARITYLGK